MNIRQTIEMKLQSGKTFAAHSWKNKSRITVGKYKCAVPGGKKKYVVIFWNVCGGREVFFQSSYSVASYLQNALSRQQIKEVFGV